MSGNPRGKSEGKCPGQNFPTGDTRLPPEYTGSSAGRPKVDRATGRVDRRALRGGANDAAERSTLSTFSLLRVVHRGRAPLSTRVATVASFCSWDGVFFE